jgi:hypothetical protein
MCFYSLAVDKIRIFLNRLLCTNSLRIGKKQRRADKKGRKDTFKIRKGNQYQYSVRPD